MGFFACVYAVNRRVGGLENTSSHHEPGATVNRRVGGLENALLHNTLCINVNRRVGGLEISRDLQQTRRSREPPCRRLRNHQAMFL